MEQQLFRQKSLERISSPEELQDYMHVTSPRLWMILTAIVILLAGFIVYASTTTLENTMPIKVQLETFEVISDDQDGAENERITYASAYIPIDYKDSISIGMQVRIGQETGRISYFGFSEEEAATIYTLIEMEHRYLPMPDGEYDAELVLESTTPISFLWNN